MKKAFTLLELIVVIIIIGILATLGFAQYSRMIERTRGAEAKQIIGMIRTRAAAIWLEKQVDNQLPPGTFKDSALGIGPARTSELPAGVDGVCGNDKHYFQYYAYQLGDATLVVSATRCWQGGKEPRFSEKYHLIRLNSDFANGTDIWFTNGPY